MNFFPEISWTLGPEWFESHEDHLERVGVESHDEWLERVTTDKGGLSFFPAVAPRKRDYIYNSKARHPEPDVDDDTEDDTYTHCNRCGSTRKWCRCADRTVIPNPHVHRLLAAQAADPVVPQSTSAPASGVSPKVAFVPGAFTSFPKALKRDSPERQDKQGKSNAPSDGSAITTPMESSSNGAAVATLPTALPPPPALGNTPQQPVTLPEDDKDKNEDDPFALFNLPSEVINLGDAAQTLDAQQAMLDEALSALPFAPQPQPGASTEVGHDIDANDPDTQVANILANANQPARLQQYADGDFDFSPQEALLSMYNTEQQNNDQNVTMSEHVPTTQEFYVTGDEAVTHARAYAKLQFVDGDYMINTHDVMLGRDLGYFREWKREKKRNVQRDRQAQQAYLQLQLYKKEPSQPGDEEHGGVPSNSSQSLEGRPAPPSNFSASGGAVGFQPSDGEGELAGEAVRRSGRKKHRTGQYSKSSTSNNSVVPANLHTNLGDIEYGNRPKSDSEEGLSDRTYAFVAIHPQYMEDIARISKEHALVRYNFREQYWELHVTGNRAVHNGELVERGKTVRLKHNDEIQIVTVIIIFKLPDNHCNSPGPSHGTFSAAGDLLNAEDSDSEAMFGVSNTSPARRLSNACEGVDSSEDEPLAASTQERSKVKLKLSNKRKEKGKGRIKPQDEPRPAPKLSLKKQQRRASEDVSSPDVAKKTEKGKKPKAADKEPAKQPTKKPVKEPTKELAKAEPTEPVVDPTEDGPKIEGPPAEPQPPPSFEPGSALESVPTNELPQKRKGPGRPPKNGLVSKRDTLLVNKKKREYEKVGQTPPAFNILLDQVRAETKFKEQQAKAQAGSLPHGVVPQLPPGHDLAGQNTTVVQSTEHGGPAGGAAADPTRRPSSPRPKRVARSPSPMKRKDEYTEEQLKKPPLTYIFLIDEILRKHPTGQADLQEIYDRIQKTYPHYRYGIVGTGWQSSVRHNLLSAPRFKECGRSGKGKLWTINWDVSLEREKKKRTTPPPPPRPMPPMNGQYMQGYGQQQQYGPQYGPPQQNGQRPANANGPGGYYSPYQHGQPGQQPPGQGPPPQAGQAPHGQQPQFNGQPPQQQPVQQDPLIREILAFRSNWLQRYMIDPPTGPPGPKQPGPDFEARTAWFTKATVHYSDRYHSLTSPEECHTVVPENQEQKDVMAELERIFEKHRQINLAKATTGTILGPGRGTPSASTTTTTGAASTPPGTTTATPAQPPSGGGPQPPVMAQAPGAPAGTTMQGATAAPFGSPRPAQGHAVSASHPASNGTPPGHHATHVPANGAFGSPRQGQVGPISSGPQGVATGAPPGPHATPTIAGGSAAPQGSSVAVQNIPASDSHAAAIRSAPVVHGTSATTSAVASPYDSPNVIQNHPASGPHSVGSRTSPGVQPMPSTTNASAAQSGSSSAPFSGSANDGLRPSSAGNGSSAPQVSTSAAPSPLGNPPAVFTGPSNGVPQATAASAPPVAATAAAWAATGSEQPRSGEPSPKTIPATPATAVAPATVSATPAPVAVPTVPTSGDSKLETSAIASVAPMAPGVKRAADETCAASETAISSKKARTDDGA